MSQNIITIDGPAGAGKSTIARMAATRLGLRYLDTGAMYRALTLHCMRLGVALTDARAVIAACQAAEVTCELTFHGPMRVKLGGEDVTDLIRTPEVTRNIRYIADLPEVRAKLVSIQREIGRQGDLVTEGRDQGTVVFPDAALKVYMVATPEVRARRRHKELLERGSATTYEEVLQDVARRDYLDMGREVGGLRRAADAIELDTSELTLEQVAEAIVKLAKERLAMHTRKVDKEELARMRREQQP